jgi:hypothetical protein
MTSAARRNTKTVLFTVEGAGSFPIDMLRYDACYPATEQDSWAAEFDMEGNISQRRVTLKHRVTKDENLNHYPCEDRWKSLASFWTPGTLIRP